MNGLNGLIKAPLLVFIGFLLNCTAGCERGSGSVANEFISGSYVRTIDNEFSKGTDLLVIQQKQGSVYAIQKISQVVRIRNGKALPIKYDTVIWTGVYDEREMVIYERQKGKVIAFMPSENKLLVGGIEYRKIK